MAETERDPLQCLPAHFMERDAGAGETTMGNPLETLGHDIKVGAVDIGKDVAKGVDVAIVQPIEFVVKAEKVISTAVKDQPIVRDAVMALVKQATTVIDDFKTDVSDGLINLSADEQTLKDAEAFFNWFKSTFIPTIEKVYGDVSADVG
jgi:hypothetical protein